MIARAIAALAIASACGRIGFDTSGDGSTFQYVGFEAESGQVAPAFEVVASGSASGGKYVEDGNLDGYMGSGSLVVTFSVAASPRPFVIWARVIAATTGDDSFEISVDGASPIPFRTCVNGLSPDWQWVAVTNDCPAGADCCATTNLTYSFAAGLHVLELTSREGRSIVDRFVVSDDPAYAGG